MEKKKKGFAIQPKDFVVKMARKGGKSIPHDGRALVMDRVLAAEIGRKGGLKSGETRRRLRDERLAREEEENDRKDF